MKIKKYFISCLGVISLCMLPHCSWFINKQKANEEITLSIIKPDAVRARNAGKIIDSIEHNGFTIARMKKIQLTPAQTEKFYAIHKDKSFFKDLVEFMTSGPVIVMALEKENAILDWRTLMGNTNPNKSIPGTLRRLFGTSITENAVHGSDAPETAKAEVAFFFPDL